MSRPSVVIRFPVVQVPQQVVEREDVLAPVAVTTEDDVRPAAHARRRVPLVRSEMQAVALNRADEHSLISRTRQLVLRKKIFPRAEVADALVGRRPISQLKQRWRSARHDASDEAQGEGVRVPADAWPELLRDPSRDFAQG